MASCKYCGESGLHWADTDDGWRLMDRDGQHRCDAEGGGPCRTSAPKPTPKQDQVLDYEDKIGTCADCRYFDTKPTMDKPQGVCRANSPMTTTDDVWASWPSVRGTDWCGDYREKRATQEGGR